jgi:hypothetical protein
LCLWNINLLFFFFQAIYSSQHMGRIFFDHLNLSYLLINCSCFIHKIFTEKIKSTLCTTIDELFDCQKYWKLLRFS